MEYRVYSRINKNAPWTYIAKTLICTHALDVALSESIGGGIECESKITWRNVIVWSSTKDAHDIINARGSIYYRIDKKRARDQAKWAKAMEEINARKERGGPAYESEPEYDGPIHLPNDLA